MLVVKISLYKKYAIYIGHHHRHLRLLSVDIRRHVQNHETTKDKGYEVAPKPWSILLTTSKFPNQLHDFMAHFNAVLF